MLSYLISASVSAISELSMVVRRTDFLGSCRDELGRTGFKRQNGAFLSRDQEMAFNSFVIETLQCVTRYLAAVVSKRSLAPGESELMPSSRSISCRQLTVKMDAISLSRRRMVAKTIATARTVIMASQE